MDVMVYWERLGLRNPTMSQTQNALAAFADKYSCIKEQVTIYNGFNHGNNEVIKLK